MKKDRTNIISCCIGEDIAFIRSNTIYVQSITLSGKNTVLLRVVHIAKLMISS